MSSIVGNCAVNTPPPFPVIITDPSKNSNIHAYIGLQKVSMLSIEKSSPYSVEFDLELVQGAGGRSPYIMRSGLEQVTPFVLDIFINARAESEARFQSQFILDKLRKANYLEKENCEANLDNLTVDSTQYTADNTVIKADTVLETITIGSSDTIRNSYRELWGSNRNVVSVKSLSLAPYYNKVWVMEVTLLPKYGLWTDRRTATVLEYLNAIKVLF